MGLLSILLLILKIIGITLLVIIELLLLVITVILFSPIKYYIDAKYDGKPDVRVKVTYLYRLLRVFFEFNTEAELTVKVLCFTINSADKEKKEKKSKKSQNKKKKAKDAQEDFKDDLLEAGKEEAEAEADAKAEVETGAEADTTVSDEKKSEENTDSGLEEKENSTEASDDTDKSKAIKKKSSDSKKKSKQPRKKTGKTQGNNDIIEKIKSVTNLIKENKHIISFVWKHVKKLFKHVLPGSHVINLKLGLDDPATLGEILGAVSVARAGTNLQINITPDFENKVIEADCHFRGKIRIFTLIFIALKVYFNKDVKKIINKLKA